MAKGRKKKSTTETVTEPMTGETEHTATAVVDEPPRDHHRDEPPFEPTGTYSPEAQPPHTDPAEGRGRFRSWTSNSSRGYTKLVDKEKERLVLLFDQKPSGDVRTAMKGAGFQYQPEYYGYKHAWTRRNDYEGRLQVEALETLIRTQQPGAPSAER